MIKHHPTPEQLSAFSSGSLAIHQAAAISVHLENCSQCQENVRKLQNIGGVVFEQLDSQSVSQDLKSKVLGKIASQDSAQKGEEPSKDNSATNKCGSVLDKFIPEDFDQLDWKWTGSGIHVAKLESLDKGSQLSLLKIAPGKAIASHTHKSDEITVLLKGSLSDELGVYHKGDYIVMDENHEHRPVASSDEECICLTVIETPLHFTGFFMSLLNPIISKHLA